MYPLDTAQAVPSHQSHPMSPPYVDEDPNQEMTDLGMEIAEDEKRDLATDEYESEALSSEDPEEALDDIDYPEGNNETVEPELSAMHEDFPHTK